MSVAILVPVLRRPHRVQPLLDSIKAATSQPWRALFICDPYDLKEQEAVQAAGGRFLIVSGNYAQKINTAVKATSDPLLFLGADDLHFHPGWLEAAQALLSDTIGVVGTNDLGNRRVMAGDHSTHSLVTRWYAQLGTIDEPDKVLHEGYPHEFVDDEFIATAKKRGAFAHASDSIVEHLHPLWGKAPTDELYDGHAMRMRRGRRIYARRQPLWT